MREQPHNKHYLPCKKNLTGDNPKKIEAQHRKSDVRRACRFQAEPWYNQTILLTYDTCRKAHRTKRFWVAFNFYKFQKSFLLRMVWSNVEDNAQLDEISPQADIHTWGPLQASSLGTTPHNGLGKLLESDRVVLCHQKFSIYIKHIMRFALIRVNNFDPYEAGKAYIGGKRVDYLLFADNITLIAKTLERA